MQSGTAKACAGLPVVDDALGAELRRACRDQACWQALVAQFEAEALTLLAEAAAAADVHTERAALHRLRGAAASMAAPRLAHVVGTLEASTAAAPRWRLARETLDSTLTALRLLA